MKSFNIFLLTLLISGCSHIRDKSASMSVDEAINKICFNGSGSGRVTTIRKVYPFSFDMGEEPPKWILAIKFPLQPEVVAEFDPSSDRGSQQLTQTLLTRLQGVSPRYLEEALKRWQTFLNATKSTAKKRDNFSSSNGELKYEDKDFTINFSHYYQGVFRKQQIIIGHEENLLKVTLSVRECLKSI